MKINREEILHVARLARLELQDAELDMFADQITRILQYVDTLNQIDTTGVPPMTHAISLTNAFREDVPAPHLDRTQALANAPEKEGGAFIVPRVVG